MNQTPQSGINYYTPQMYQQMQNFSQSQPINQIQQQQQQQQQGPQ